jgi:hypothetical protein
MPMIPLPRSRQDNERNVQEQCIARREKVAAANATPVVVRLGEGPVNAATIGAWRNRSATTRNVNGRRSLIADLTRRATRCHPITIKGLL